MRKIHCLNPVAKCGTGLFPADYKLTKDAAEANGILAHSASTHDMDPPECLLAVGRAGAGANSILLDACTKAGIVIFNISGASTSGVKELVITGMLVASKDIMDGTGRCKANAEDGNITKDTEKSRKASAGYEIKGRRLGVVGPGAIGAKVINAVARLGMEIYGYDPYTSVNVAWRLSRNVERITNMDAIFRECDYITIHVPLLDSARGVTSREKLAMMRDGVMALNFPRDTLVSDDDMAATLEEERVRYYVGDFPSPKMVNTKNVILMPHLGTSTQESEDNCAVMAVKEMTDHLENGNIKNSVNYPSCDTGICQTESRMAVLHINTPNTIGQVAGTLAGQGMNISDMANRGRNKYAYTPLDLEHKAGEAIVEKLRAIKGVLRVRVVK